jgi:hypothetical protein
LEKKMPVIVFALEERPKDAPNSEYKDGEYRVFANAPSIDLLINYANEMVDRDRLLRTRNWRIRQLEKESLYEDIEHRQARVIATWPLSNWAHIWGWGV